MWLILSKFLLLNVIITMYKCKISQPNIAEWWILERPNYVCCVMGSWNMFWSSKFCLKNLTFLWPERFNQSFILHLSLGLIIRSDEEKSSFFFRKKMLKKIVINLPIGSVNCSQKWKIRIHLYLRLFTWIESISQNNNRNTKKCLNIAWNFNRTS